ncbi:hypothetical protein GQ55_9G621000 [Panicum hallii var. hallii]|uniref:Uncharacterized protein n=1 Tax=Panicum hallii var. hallii TaxID=1504633 RepID=A0A2T7CHU6_9POAL|nr:hypothetical protein GQ55_9G621000 [Panicum hallii var. hallii]
MRENLLVEMILVVMGMALLLMKQQTTHGAALQMYWILKIRKRSKMLKRFQEIFWRRYGGGKEVAANLNPDWLLDSADPAVAKSCIDMEEELVSEWEKHVVNCPDEILPVNTFIQSCLIKERALSISGDKFSVPSGIAFVCITKEADLMLELLKHGAKITDDMIHQSSVVRMCALGLVNLKGCQSVAAAAAMMGMAKEAKMMCDWMKRENKLLTFNMSEPPEPEVARFIRDRTLDVMISMLQESSFPSSKDQKSIYCLLD